MSVKINPPIHTQPGPAGHSADGQPQRWRWYHGIAFYVIMQAMTFGLAGLVSGALGKQAERAGETIFSDVPYFKSLRQAKIAPPSWVFGPAWTINNASVIYGLLRTLNMARDTPGRKTYLALQAASWLDYALFSAAYFSLRSPINALALSMGMLGLTIASACVAFFKLKDTRVALSLATLCIWLIIACSAAIAQAAWNHDELYNVGPFLEPRPALVKKSVS
jgi:tryptophan-rich sensory protein